MRPRHKSSPLLVAALLAVLTLAGCSDAEPDSAPASAPSYDSEGVTARVLPQLAAEPSDETLAADEAAWVVEAKVKDAQAGAAVRLLALQDDEWETVDEAELDKRGRATLTTTADGDLHVVTEGEDGDIGDVVTTQDAPAESFVDDFDEDSLSGEKPTWGTRDQGYIGVRQCSKADPEAAEVSDGVLKLSVLDDPDKEQCTVKGEQYDYRLNGHVGTEHSYSFTYGYAAARVKFQEDRGQHGSFWIQSPGGGVGPTQPEAGAEIDVIEYFGDDHPQGGLTSFTYWSDPSGKKNTQGGWIEDAEDYGDDWSEEFHVFSVEWTPKEYVFRIDGQVTHRLKGKTSAQPEFLILSLLSSDYELEHSEELPQTMEVDWARVWETPAG